MDACFAAEAEAEAEACSEAEAEAEASGNTTPDDPHTLDDPNCLLACYADAQTQLRERRVRTLRVRDTRQMFRVMCRHQRDTANRTNWFVPATGLTTGEFSFLQVAPIVSDVAPLQAAQENQRAKS